MFLVGAKLLIFCQIQTLKAKREEKGRKKGAFCPLSQLSLIYKGIKLSITCRKVSKVAVSLIIYISNYITIYEILRFETFATKTNIFESLYRLLLQFANLKWLLLFPLLLGRGVVKRFQAKQHRPFQK